MHFQENMRTFKENTQPKSTKLPQPNITHNNQNITHTTHFCWACTEASFKLFDSMMRFKQVSFKYLEYDYLDKVSIIFVSNFRGNQTWKNVEITTALCVHACRNTKFNVQHELLLALLRALNRKKLSRIFNQSKFLRMQTTL